VPARIREEVGANVALRRDDAKLLRRDVKPHTIPGKSAPGCASVAFLYPEAFRAAVEEGPRAMKITLLRNGAKLKAVFPVVDGKFSRTKVVSERHEQHPSQDCQPSLDCQPSSCGTLQMVCAAPFRQRDGGEPVGKGVEGELFDVQPQQGL